MQLLIQQLFGGLAIEFSTRSKMSDLAINPNTRDIRISPQGNIEQILTAVDVVKQSLWLRISQNNLFNQLIGALAADKETILLDVVDKINQETRIDPTTTEIVETQPNQYTVNCQLITGENIQLLF